MGTVSGADSVQNLVCSALKFGLSKGESLMVLLGTQQAVRSGSLS
jgi:hypothetical protein